MWWHFFRENFFYIRIRLNLDKHLRIKVSDKSLTQRFDVSMTSLSSEKIKYRLDVYLFRHTYHAHTITRQICCLLFTFLTPHLVYIN